MSPVHPAMSSTRPVSCGGRRAWTRRQAMQVGRVRSACLQSSPAVRSTPVQLLQRVEPVMTGANPAQLLPEDDVCFFARSLVQAWNEHSQSTQLLCSTPRMESTELAAGAAGAAADSDDARGRRPKDDKWDTTADLIAGWLGGAGESFRRRSWSERPCARRSVRVSARRGRTGSTARCSGWAGSGSPSLDPVHQDVLLLRRPYPHGRLSYLLTPPSSQLPGAVGVLAGNPFEVRLNVSIFVRKKR